ncbi:MAG TPA: phytoene desaturase family protein [Jatrophihabitantaceae bacterium]|jgi:phytoene desaturase
MARVVVVGAGVGGLAAAARLAALGHDVTVLEAGDTVGGKVGRIEHRAPAGTFRFDTGASMLTMPEVFTELFADTGDPLDSVATMRAVDPLVRYRFTDGTVVSTTRDLDEQVARFDQAFGPGAGAAWATLIARGSRIWDAIERPVFGQTLTARGVARRLANLGDLAAVGPGRTLRQLANRHFDDPRLRLMLERYATYAGSDPRRAPAALTVIPYLEHAYGAWYVEGGLHVLVTALADRVRERGGVIRTDARVARIHTAAGRVSEVALVDGTVLAADVVVANADASVVYRQLLSPARRTAPTTDSLSAFVLLLGVRGRTPGLAHHNVLFGDGEYDAEFDAVFGRPGRPVTDPVVYISAPDDPAICPAGHEAWFVLVNAPRHGVDGTRGALDWDSAGLASGYEGRVLSLLAARGLPVRERLVFSTVITPADLQRRTGAPGGAIYGAALHGLRSSVRRPTNASRVRGLYLVGGSTQPGGGLPLVALSAKFVAKLVGPA